VLDAARAGSGPSSRAHQPTERDKGDGASLRNPAELSQPSQELHRTNAELENEPCPNLHVDGSLSLVLQATMAQDRDSWNDPLAPAREEEDEKSPDSWDEAAVRRMGRPSESPGQQLASLFAGVTLPSQSYP
jgi:hypothetical protein